MKSKDVAGVALGPQVIAVRDTYVAWSGYRSVLSVPCIWADFTSQQNLERENCITAILTGEWEIQVWRG